MILMLSFFILFKIVKLKSFIDLANWVNQKEVFINMVCFFLNYRKNYHLKLLRVIRQRCCFNSLIILYLQDKTKVSVIMFVCVSNCALNLLYLLKKS